MSIFFLKKGLSYDPYKKKVILLYNATKLFLFVFSFLKPNSYYNFQNFSWRATKFVKNLSKELKQIIFANNKIWDQNGFNKLVGER